MQCRRTRLPRWSAVTDFTEVAARPGAALATAAVATDLEPSLVLIGPRRRLVRRRSSRVTSPGVRSGDHVLRAETAAIVAGALLTRYVMDVSSASVWRHPIAIVSGAWHSLRFGNYERSRRNPGRLTPARRRAAPGDPAPEAAVTPGGRSGLEPGVQGLGAGRLRAGERAISVLRLQRLARFYDVPVDQLLPDDGSEAAQPVGHREGRQGHHRPRRLARMNGDQFGDAGPVPPHDPGAAPGLQRPGATVRNDDLRAIARCSASSSTTRPDTLDELGLRFQAD